MTDNGAVSKALNCGGSYIIPKGYHNGSGKITANSLASQTSATATAARIGKGYTAWVDGTKITGTAAAMGSLNVSSAIYNITLGSTAGTTVTKTFTASAAGTYIMFAFQAGQDTVSEKITVSTSGTKLFGALQQSSTATEKRSQSYILAAKLSANGTITVVFPQQDKARAQYVVCKCS